MATYEKGDDIEGEIGRIQAKLAIAVDDKFGPRMLAAVKAWQTANGHKPDGMIGPDMLLALGLTDLIVLEHGDEGALVGRVQARLGLEVDGDYDGKAVKAVRAFQKANGLKASGNADLKTLKAMGVLDAQAPRADAATAAAKPSPAKSKGAAPRPEPASATSVPATGSVAPNAGPGAIRSWAYQLQDVNPKKIAALDIDLVVVDYAADGSHDTAFKPADVQRMRQRPGGGTKKVVSYMSIGEAEDYRFYWQDAWKAQPPAWLDDENPEWKGNYKVRYWDAGWQAVILGNPGAYLDRIMAAGFDGVYLDIIDGFEYWRDEKGEKPDADRDMIVFVKRISAYARAKRPGFLIIPQNGEELLADAGYRSGISIQAKEDIFYGQDGDGKANAREAIAHCVECLAHATSAGVPVIAVEYLDSDRKIADASAKLAQIGCVAYFGPRDLDEIDPGLNKKNPR